MTSGPSLSLGQARHLHLGAQGLLGRPPSRADARVVLRALRRMGVLQIDSINVVARSPYLVLFSRIGAYEPSLLDHLLAEGHIFECWAHAASFAAMDDYPLHRRRQLDGTARSAGASWGPRLYARDREQMEALLERIRSEGPARAADFEAPPRGAAGWWNWKLEKLWLEAWFAIGELMVARRENFQRVYDLRERVLSRAAQAGGAGGLCDDGKLPSSQAAGRELVLRAVRALGLTQARWIADYFRTGARCRDKDLDELVAEGDLLRVQVDRWSGPGYVHRGHRELLAKAVAGKLRATHSTVLSPFDPVVWDRERALALFGFDYRLECYVPAEKRRYGYYVLPVLHRGRLVARLDAKAERREGTFAVKAMFAEPDVALTDDLCAGIARALRECAEWHRTPALEIGSTEPRELGVRVRAALAKLTVQPEAGPGEGARRADRCSMPSLAGPGPHRRGDHERPAQARQRKGSTSVAPP